MPSHADELRALFERSKQAGHVAPSRHELRNMLKEAGCPDDENTLNALVQAVAESGNGEAEKVATDVARAFDKILAEKKLREVFSEIDSGSGFYISKPEDLADILSKAALGDTSGDDLIEMYAKCQAFGTDNLTLEQLVTAITNWATDKLDTIAADLEAATTADDNCVLM